MSDAINIIKQLAPVIGTALGGPAGALGGAAVSWLAQKLGASAETAESVANAIQGIDPLALKQLEQDFSKWYITEQNRMLEVYLNDTQDARKRDSEFVKLGKSNTRANWIVGITFAGLLACIAIAVGMSSLNEFGKSAVNLLLGVLIADWKQITAFEFGTSRGSQGKDVTIENLSKQRN